ncbi:MAG TPA: PAS domain-containing protein [Pseudolabrys sp.]|nr:PAS domain-containing protein [Pseudolabrys sp.]
MRHASSQALYDYWNGCRGMRAAPERAEIDPAAIRHILADTVVVQIDLIEQSQFRLAGTRVCALFGREIRGEPFLPFWHAESVAGLRRALAAVTDGAGGIVGSAVGASQAGDRVDLEVLLLPLLGAGQACTAVIGVLAPLSPTYWLGTHPLTTLRFGRARLVGANAASRPQRPAPPSVTADSGRRIGGFVVYDGGRQGPAAETFLPPAG